MNFKKDKEKPGTREIVRQMRVYNDGCAEATSEQVWGELANFANHQEIIKKNGHPEWAVVSYKEYQRLVAQAEMLHDVRDDDEAKLALVNIGPITPHPLHPAAPLHPTAPPTAWPPPAGRPPPGAPGPAHPADASDF